MWHQYTVLITEDAPVARDEVVTKLAERGVGCGIYYPQGRLRLRLLPQQPAGGRADVPVATKVAAQCLSLPVHQHLSDEDVDTVVATVREVLAG